MQPVFFFGIALAAMMTLSILVVVIQAKQIKNLMSQNQTLTNLATSKDLMTFQQMQATTNLMKDQSVELEPINPLNDEAVAHRLAEDFKRAGVDPNYAYNQDDVSFLDEFGLNS